MRTENGAHADVSFGPGGRRLITLHFDASRRNQRQKERAATDNFLQHRQCRKSMRVTRPYENELVVLEVDLQQLVDRHRDSMLVLE